MLRKIILTCVYLVHMTVLKFMVSLSNKLHVLSYKIVLDATLYTFVLLYI